MYSRLEAYHCGCYPLVPDRLAYPEIYDPKCLYTDNNDLYKRLRGFCRSPYIVNDQWKKLKIDLCQFSTDQILPLFDEFFTGNK